jgi:prophage regulatory protein
MAQQAQSLPSINPLYRRPIVEQATGESRSTIYRKISKGLFTKPVSIGGDRVAWPANEVQALINARIAGKSEEQIKALVIELEAARSNVAGGNQQGSH